MLTGMTSIVPWPPFARQRYRLPGKQSLDRFAPHLVVGVTEQRLCLAVRLMDLPSAVDDDHRVRIVLEQLQEPALHYLRPLTSWLWGAPHVPSRKSFWSDSHLRRPGGQGHGRPCCFPTTKASRS